jgi:transcriptional regulator with XRE-family HTH domain
MLVYMPTCRPMARETLNPQSVDAIGHRLLVLRKALGYSQVAMAQLMAQAPSTWAMYETGERRIHIDQALKLCGTVGCSLDWIYRGNFSSLPVDLAEKIHIQMGVEAAMERSTRRRS